MNPSTELFARLLPDFVVFRKRNGKRIKAGLHWNDWPEFPEVKETEYLHLCHLVEKTLDVTQRVRYCNQIGHCSDWTKRLTALAQVKGVL